MPNPQILLYNFKDPERLRMIRRYLNRQKIDVQIVQPAQYLESLGYLFSLPGFSGSGAFNMGGNFHEEMMVMNGFSEKQQDDFLAFFRENALAPVALKAVLTPVTRHWHSLKLYQELSQEHREMHKQ